MGKYINFILILKFVNYIKIFFKLSSDVKKQIEAEKEALKKE